MLKPRDRVHISFVVNTQLIKLSKYPTGNYVVHDSIKLMNKKHVTIAKRT